MKTVGLNPTLWFFIDLMNSVGTFASQQHNGPICQLPLRHQWTATKTAGNSQEQSTARESEPVYSIISVLFFHDEQQQESSYSNPPTNISVWDHPYITSAYFKTFSDRTHPLCQHEYSNEHLQNGHFTNSPTLSFCRRNIEMVPIWPASKKSPCNPEFLMKLDAHSGSSLCIFLFGENIYQAIFTLFFQIFWFLVACNFPIKCIFNNTLRI